MVDRNSLVDRPFRPEAPKHMEKLYTPMLLIGSNIFMHLCLVRAPQRPEDLDALGGDSDQLGRCLL